MVTWSKLLVVDYNAANAAADFTHSLHDTGFAVIKNHPIAAALIEEVYAEWRRFFALPATEKMLYAHQDPKLANLGYYPFRSENAKGNPIKDLKEFYHYCTWLPVPKGISDKTRQLYDQLNNMAANLLQWIESCLPVDILKNLSMPLSEMIQDSPRTIIRILNYPPLSGEEEPGSIRGAAHEDINLITLLPTATTSGLQVKDTQDHWYDVPCDAGTIAVNTGDMLKRVTQGYLVSTQHRVMNPAGDAAKQSRLSMPMFVQPRDEVLLDEHCTAKDFLFERLRENGVVM